MGHHQSLILISLNSLFDHHMKFKRGDDPSSDEQSYKPF